MDLLHLAHEGISRKWMLVQSVKLAGRSGAEWTPLSNHPAQPEAQLSNNEAWGWWPDSEASNKVAADTDANQTWQNGKTYLYRFSQRLQWEEILPERWDDPRIIILFLFNQHIIPQITFN